MKYALVAILLGWLAACAPTQGQKPVVDGGYHPPIVSKTLINGRGHPSGRSDGREPFMAPSAVSVDPTYGYSYQNPIKIESASACS